MATAMTASNQRKAQAFAMAISFLLALPLAVILLVHPSLMLDANGHYNHSQLMLVMVGISEASFMGWVLCRTSGYGNGCLVHG